MVNVSKDRQDTLYFDFAASIAYNSIQQYASVVYLQLCVFFAVQLLGAKSETPWWGIYLQQGISLGIQKWNIGRLLGIMSENASFEVLYF